MDVDAEGDRGGGVAFFPQAPMRSERMSRVCIVVLEEVEEDELSSLHSKTAQDHVSQHSPPEADTQEEKVRMRRQGGRFAFYPAVLFFFLSFFFFLYD